MRQEVPTWLAVVIILVVLVVVIGAYIYFTRPWVGPGVEEMPPHAVPTEQMKKLVPQPPQPQPTPPK